MKDIKKQIEDSKLLAAKVLGILNEKQEQALKDWESNASNKKVEEDILNAESFKEWNEKLDGFDTSESWEQFIARMQKTKTPGKIIFTPWFKTSMSIAASIILLISIGLFFYVDRMKDDVEIVADNEMVKPGEFKATLTLSTGEKVRLTDNKIDSISDKGYSIQHDVDSGIDYTKESSAKAKKASMVYNTLKVARGEEYKIVLADGTSVWLNADSEIKYPVQFLGEQRTVYLQGEAYFDVTHNKDQPFVVHSHEMQVKVYGTEFCLEAYEKEEIKTVLVEGSVGIKSQIKGTEVKLKPGELGTSVAGDTKVKKVNVRPYIAWKDGDFVFEHERLESIMMKLERWYNVKIFYMNEECKDFRFTGDVKRYEDVHKLLKFIQLTSKAKFEVNKNTIVVMKK
jgi:hypothetical protein